MQGGRLVFLSPSHGHPRAWSETMVEQVKRMGSALARNKGEDDGDVIRHLSQRVAVVLARLNASMLLNRAPQNTPANIDGIN